MKKLPKVWLNFRDACLLALTLCLSLFKKAFLEIEDFKLPEDEKFMISRGGFGEDNGSIAFGFNRRYTLIFVWFPEDIL